MDGTIYLMLAIAVLFLWTVATYYIGLRDGIDIAEEAEYAEEIKAYESRGVADGTIIPFPKRNAN